MEKFYSFDYADVRLNQGLLHKQLQEAIVFYTNIPNDNLLKSYRKRAGMDAPGDNMGGWYDNPGHPGGHLLGHVISGLARVYRNIGDREILNKLNTLVHEFGKTIRDDGYFYNHPETEEKELDYYVYDKLAIGLLDAYRYADNQEALLHLDKITDWVIQSMPLKELGFEWYTMPENLYEAYQTFRDKKYKELADRLIYHEWYKALHQNVNVLPGKHAYSHVNALCSAARIYQETKDEKYLLIIQNAYRMILADQLYASGGYGPGEAFVEPGSNTLWEALFGQEEYNKFNSNKNHEAPCNSYALLKLSRYMMSFNGDMSYGDVMERVIFNTLLGTLKPADNGISPYYDTYRPGALKTYFTEQNNQTWPCCSGTYIQALADYAKDLYFYDEQGIYVNLFVNSKVSLEKINQDGYLKQITDFPFGNRTCFQVSLKQPGRFSLAVRIPAWTDKSMQISINGVIDRKDVEPGSIWSVAREWKDGDQVVFLMAKKLRLESISQASPHACALMYGPILLVGQTISDAIPMGKEEFLASIIPVPGQELIFTTTGLQSNFFFVPYFSIQDQTTAYTTYFKINADEPDSVLFDDIHTSWIYSNGWKKGYLRNFNQAIKINDFTHYAIQNGAQARITFEGVGVCLISGQSPKHRKMRVQLDGYPAEIVAQQSDKAVERQVVWEKKGLPEVAHTLVLTALLTDEDMNLGAYAELDAIEVYPIPHKKKQ